MIPCGAAGLVGGVQFAVLPAVGAGVAAAAVLLAQAPAMAALWRRPSRQLPGGFTGAVAYALLCSFVWGYHVHEKAILMVIFLYSLPVTMAFHAYRSSEMLPPCLAARSAGAHTRHSCAGMVLKNKTVTMRFVCLGGAALCTRRF